MLHAWVQGWYQRHERELASEGVPFALRIGRKSYRVTSEQALVAVSRTTQELDAALGGRPDWGCDAHGRPCDLAMRGLINRRLESRIIDQLRCSAPAPTQSLSAPLSGGAYSQGLTLGDTIADHGAVAGAETGMWLVQILTPEGESTRELVVRRIAGESCDDISERLGMSAVAARQRLSRFRRRHLADLVDAA